MSDPVKKIKAIIKNPTEKPSFGTNPLDPWSAKANIAETTGLNDYLSSRGINPKFVSRDTKISHAKSSAYLKWKQERKFTEEVESLDESSALDTFLSSRGLNSKNMSTQAKISYAKSDAFIKWKKAHLLEATDAVDTITVDIPLMIRLLELAREDVKDDMELHKITERLIEIRGKGMLTMEDYDFIANGKAKIKEEVELNEDNLDSIAKKHGMEFNRTTYGAGMKHKTKGEVSINRYGEWHHYPAGSKSSKAHGDSASNFGSLDKHLSTLKEEILDEAKKPRTTALEKWRKAAKERENKHNQTKTKGMEDAITKLSQHLNKEEVELDESSKDNPRHPMHQSDPSLYKKTARSITKNYATHAGKFFSNKDTTDFTVDYKKTDKEAPRYKNEEVEQIDELKKSTMASYKDKSSASLKNAQANRDAAEPGKDMSKGFADLHAKSNKIAKNRVKGLIGYMQRKQGMKPTSEDMDPLAACSNTADGANGGETVSKSAKLIKSLYKKNTVKEETYDWQKDDKSVQTYGKKPKVNTPNKDANFGDNKPAARAIMKGGTTLTGEPRDMVEIDPSMKQRPDQPEKPIPKGQIR